MFDENVAAQLEDSASIQAVFVSTLEEGLLYETWSRGMDDVDVSALVASFSAIALSSFKGLKVLGDGTLGVVTIESSHALVLLHELQEQFLVGYLFTPTTPLGLARLQAEGLSAVIGLALDVVAEEMPPPPVTRIERVGLPSSSSSSSSSGLAPALAPVREEANAVGRAEQILSHLSENGPEPHAARLRLALQTGLPVDTFEDPSTMNAHQTQLLERATCDILGVDQLPF